jgi:uroporphyrinogen-III synthase
VKPRLLVLRSGERPFSADLVPELDLLEKRTHEFESLAPDAPGGAFDLVLFTSGAAAERFLARESLAACLSERAAVYAVGPATGALLRRRGVAPVREGGGSVRSLLESLPENLVGARVLLPRGEDADDELPRGLAARGAAVVPVTMYRKTSLPYDPALDEVIGSRPPAVFFATSPSAARWFFDGASPESARRLSRIPAIALGQPTEAALLSHGAQRVSIARPPAFESAARLAVRLAAAPSPT